MNNRESFLHYLNTCVKSTRSTQNNPLYLAGNAPKDYARFLESDRLFDYNPERWKDFDMYSIDDPDEAERIFYKLYNDRDFQKRNNNDNQGWRQGAISHYVCYLRAKKYFRGNKQEEVSSPPKTILRINLPLQQIFYGAPGTGKSHTVEQVCKQYKHHRTTFHPDSDYSTFVGCYKPTMENKVGTYSVDELISKLTAIKNTGTPYPCHKFSAKYWESLKDLSTHDIKRILSACGFTETMNVEVSKGIAIGQDMAGNASSKQITYSFVPQTFIQAYTDAWQNLNESVFLVVEEINRGNCAQIFGDLFQLLDRKDDGYSSYEIDADKDLQGYLCEFFAENGIDENAPEDIKLGKKLLLPPNLHIWATMNTSDQSLFPIDSAFKRRWDWKYVPIDEEKENWSIEVNGTLYSWSSFLKIINEKIYTKTNSEDKQLGFYFCKAKDGIISADKFVSKVLFYIYNDIFKDYGFDEDFFKDDEDNKTLSFRKYYDRSGNVNEGQVEKFLKKLEVEVTGVKEVVDDEDPLPEVDEDGNNASSNTKDFTKYSINGTGSYSKGGVVYESMKLYVDNNPSKNAQEIVNDWLALGVNVPNFVETKAMFDARKQNSRDSRINEKAKIVTLPNGQTIYVSNQYNPERINELIAKVNAANWNINISKV